jgi:NAD(P)H-dependent flavin oxidoreductase YrpB (nitropropane dioxygenase family)
MNVAAGPELAAAVTNAGGLGVIGGHGYTPKVLRQQVRIAARAWSFRCNAATSDPSH